MATYSELLKDPRWQKKRLDVFNRDEWQCKSCFSKEKTLHVHHIRYLKGHKPWEYEMSNFITLCESCHQDETSLIKNDNLSEQMIRYSELSGVPAFYLYRFLHHVAFACIIDPESVAKVRGILAEVRNKDYPKFEEFTNNLYNG